MVRDIVVEICRWTLVGVFGAAAIAKLRSPEQTLADFAEMGIPAPGTARYVIPGVELGVCAALMFARPWGGVAAFALLVAFTTTLISIFRSGAVVNCACFGAIAAQPVGRQQVTRNLGLLGLALVVALAG